MHKYIDEIYPWGRGGGVGAFTTSGVQVFVGTPTRKSNNADKTNETKGKKKNVFFILVSCPCVKVVVYRLECPEIDSAISTCLCLSKFYRSILLFALL